MGIREEGVTDPSHAIEGPSEMRTETGPSASATWNYLGEVGAKSGLEQVRRKAEEGS